MMLAPIDTADKVYSIDLASVAVGALAANSWAGFDSPAQQVISVSGTKYLCGASAPSWSDTAFVTKAIGRDQEISFKMSQTYQSCYVYLRYNDVTQKAVVFAVDLAGNNFKANFATVVGRVNQIKDVGVDTYIDQALGMAQGGVSLSGLVGSTFSSSDTWTFGCTGDTFYAKFNGVQFWSYRFWTHTSPGKIALLHQSNADRAYGSIVCTFKPQSVSYSDFANKRYDLRDWGFKDSKTTGSMTAGSYTLTVADASGFSVGDPIAVETTGEAGLGKMQTIGVGGAWPTFSYANEAALPNAATYRATNNPKDEDLYVWLQSTGEVWINYRQGAGGPAAWGAFTPTNQARSYYWNKVMPRALLARITGKSGNTLTLDKSAVVATTNANVYYDCSPGMQAFFANSANAGGNNYEEATDIEIVLPRGVYCVHGRYDVGQSSKWRIIGPGRSNVRLYSPKGTQVIEFWHYGSDNYWADLSIFSWNGVEYWCWDTDREYVTADYSLRMAGNRNNGRNGEFRTKAERVDFYNTFGGAVFEVMEDGLATECRAFQTNGNTQQYFGWFFGQAYCKNTFHVRCEYYAEKFGNAWEVFQADGGGFKDCISRNGYIASNFSGGNYLMENWNIVWDYRGDPFTENRWNDSIAVGLNINVNIGGGAQAPELLLSGGRIVNPDITIIQGETGLIRSAMVINTDCVGMRITGTHPAKNGKGHIKFIRYPGQTIGEVAALRTDALAVVSGIRVSGLNNGTDQYADLHGFENTGSPLFTNNVADTIYTHPVGNSVWVNKIGTDGNISNATYEALP